MTQLIRRLQSRLSYGLDLVRVALGVVLVGLGVDFLVHMSALQESVSAQGIPFDAFVLSHFLVLAHVGGGLLLVFGLVTRFAAAVQLPFLIGALAFIDFGSGFFANLSATLTLSVLSLTSLILFLGPGRLSADYLIDAADNQRTTPWTSEGSASS